MEVLTEVPQTGTKLRIDADQFDGGTHDSILRMQGQTKDGSTLFDAAYVEVSEAESEVLGDLIRALVEQPSAILDKIGQEIQATYSTSLTGQQSRQIAQQAWLVWREQVSAIVGGAAPERVERLSKLAERFERAAQKRRTPFPPSQQQHSQAGSSQS